MAGPVPRARQELPATLSWYRDAANWVVGLSAGALAAGLTYREDIAGASLAPRFLFLASALLFLLALLAGVQFYFWLISFGNQRERSQRIAEDLANTTDPEARAKLERDANDASGKIARAEHRVAFYHRALMWTFHFGVIGYAVSTLLILSAPAPETPPAKSYSIVTVPCCSARCRLPQPHVLRIEATTGETWYLSADSTRPAVWRPLSEAP